MIAAVLVIVMIFSVWFVLLDEFSIGDSNALRNDLFDYFENNSEVEMQPAKPLTKRDERRALAEIRERRNASPQRNDPVWMAAFYRRLAN